jgi:hypothetical protein
MMNLPTASWRALARRRGSIKRCGAAYRIIEMQGLRGEGPEIAQVLREGS